MSKYSPAKRRREVDLRSAYRHLQEFSCWCGAEVDRPCLSNGHHTKTHRTRGGARPKNALDDAARAALSEGARIRWDLEARARMSLAELPRWGPLKRAVFERAVAIEVERRETASLLASANGQRLEQLLREFEADEAALLGEPTPEAVPEPMGL